MKGYKTFIFQAYVALLFTPLHRKPPRKLMRDEKEMEQLVGKNPTGGPTHSMKHGTNT